MSELPEGWADTVIGDVIAPFQIIDPKKSPETEFRYIDIGSIDNSRQVIKEAKIFFGKDAPSRARRVVQAGDVLFSTVRTYLKNIALVPDSLDGSLTSTGVAVLRPSESVDGRYLFRWVCSEPFISAISKKQDGTMYPAVTDKDVYSGSIALPPLAEQRRIVAKLDRLFERTRRAREDLSHIPRLIENYKKAILAAAFRGDLVKSTPYQNWKIRRIDEISKVGTGATPKRGNGKYYDNGSIPWVTSSAVNQQKIKSAEEYITQAAIDETNCKVFPSGTLLVAMYGEGLTRGKVSMLEIEAATNQALAAIQIENNNLVDNDYLFWFLHSKYLALRALAAGGVQPNLNLGIIKGIQAPIPPLEDQKLIVEKIKNAMNLLKTLESEQNQAKYLLEHLDQANLAKAFRGELVPQDPNDEPASVLLERIRAERASQPKAAKRNIKVKEAVS